MGRIRVEQVEEENARTTFFGVLQLQPINSQILNMKTFVFSVEGWNVDDYDVV
ncbi:hypothetical protein PISMIDRAFT_685820 [Pisolithus microcarpus 441]|uniref:Uncharacterized protein n=1 Tax=Pisolithus microcarpus 441 TaxID=765257 RepID=A0A0C9YJV1_9AGAM|nr:hypothetical protein PISMIDRAFT_685820 [Pisolithus microcarpus 441]